MTRRGLLFLLLVFCSIVFGIYKFIVGDSPKAKKNSAVVAKENIYVFSGTTGPVAPSTVAGVLPHLSWQTFDNKSSVGLAVLLTDTTSCWLGLAQGLSNIGIPFTITKSAAEAAKHKVVMVYPVISGKVMSGEDLRMIAAIPDNGGTLIACNVYGGGMGEVMGYKDIVPSAKRTKFTLSKALRLPLVNDIFEDLVDKEMVIAGKNITGSLETVGYTGAENSVIDFEDGSACMVYKAHGKGRAYAIGVDLGSFFQRYMNGRGFDPDRAYVNAYDAGIDVFLRVIKGIYEAGEPSAVTLNTTPDDKPFTLLITHDIDFTRSIVNAASYADMERSKGVKATYFIQTKYVRDWNDDIFFNAENLKYLHRVQKNGMEVASHSVSHSKTFSKFEQGTGQEQYPTYVPFVKSRLETYNGSVMGELRVSKYLLEHFAPGVNVHSFRPGHLQYPFCLPQCLVASGYSNSTSVTSGGVQTNLPYMLTYNREYDALTNIVEVPVAIEDEAGLPMLQRFDSTVLVANKLSKYGGVLNVLIHTDILGQKYEYEQKLIDRYKDTAWVCTVDELCNWWRGRRDIRWDIERSGIMAKVKLVYNGATLYGVTLHVPANWQLGSTMKAARQEKNSVVIEQLSGPMELSFSVK